MFKNRMIPALIVGAALAVSGCVSGSDVTRSAGLDLGPVIDIPVQNWDFAALQVSVPETLSVSEANTIKPRADIVWREGPAGDRHTQVQDLVQAALEPSLTNLTGAIPVRFDIEVTRFHALTQRARYTIGGAHEIEFNVTIRHAETGILLSGPREVVLEFRAYGGRQTVEAEAQGITQAVRITEHLQEWVRSEFPQTVLALPLS